MEKRAPVLWALLLLPACEEGFDPSSTPGILSPGEVYSGGQTTVFDTSPQAFANPAANLSSERRLDFFPGNNLFADNWVTAPSSTSGRDGLGPTFNARSCSGCHFKDGRGAPPTEVGEPFQGLLLRLSVEGVTATGAPAPEPRYGGQLQHLAIEGVPAEGAAAVTWEERTGAYPDGEVFSLRAPTYVISELAFGPMDAGVKVSPRVAPALIGLGLLEAVSEETLETIADPGDGDGDGISGRINRVWSVSSGATAVGRFGWKAGQPTVEQQSAGAFNGDMGITSPLFPVQNCPDVQTECREAFPGGEPELDADGLEDVTYYARLLAVPARRDWDDPVVLQGKRAFLDAGCGACHIPTLVTDTLPGYPEVSGQIIHPYTDLLLHDMGEGLADHRPEFEADGSEWRTPPLWGLGLIETVNGHLFLLHDGRARGLAEAILWHGGEADASRAVFQAMDADEREALLAFLRTL